MKGNVLFCWNIISEPSQFYKKVKRSTFKKWMSKESEPVLQKSTFKK